MFFEVLQNISWNRGESENFDTTIYEPGLGINFVTCLSLTECLQADDRYKLSRLMIAQGIFSLSSKLAWCLDW